MTEKQPKEYIIIEKELKDLVAFRMPAYTPQVFVIESNVRSRPVGTRQVPDSTHLIEMANTEWKNREERRGIHNREDWCSGWIDGFLSIDKPDWSKELDAAIAAAAVDKVLDEIFDICKMNKKLIEWNRHIAEYHAEDRMDELTDVMVKIMNLRQYKEEP